MTQAPTDSISADRLPIDDSYPYEQKQAIDRQVMLVSQPPNGCREYFRINA